MLLSAVGIRTRCTVASCIAPTAASVLVVSIEDGRTVATDNARAVRVIAQRAHRGGVRRSRVSTLWRPRCRCKCRWPKRWPCWIWPRREVKIRGARAFLRRFDHDTAAFFAITSAHRQKHRNGNVRTEQRIAWAGVPTRREGQATGGAIRANVCAATGS